MKALLLTLLCSAMACGDEVKWTAVLTAGTAIDCSASVESAVWSITEKDGRVIAHADNSVDWFNINTSGLKPDGSGRINVKDAKGRPTWFEFEAGHGPRKIYAHWGYHACVWLLNPR